ncbi:MAG: hypothetical protein ACR2FS_07215, partial [Phormidesmis sp.]
MYKQLQACDIEISTGQVNRILMAEDSRFHDEQTAVLRAGLESAAYVHTDVPGRVIKAAMAIVRWSATRYLPIFAVVSTSPGKTISSSCVIR